MGSYIPSSPEERRRMMQAVGIESLDELFEAVPESMRELELNLPDGQFEMQVIETMQDYASMNTLFKSIFRGAGAYNHYIPSIVKTVASKEEFLTAYTPYQAEISQGILQSIFEYQTMICELTQMDVSNASVYDGATAAAEAVAMCRERKRTTALVGANINPMVRRTIQTYADGRDAEVADVPERGGRIDLDALKELLDEQVACVLVQQPNFYGLIEDLEPIAQAVHASGAKLIVSVNPIAMALLKTPAEAGADIAVGEGQPLGMPLGFGGPYLGFMATRQAHVRKLPGRIVGETTDIEGKRAFVLTLQAREQHIRREKALSNICSNQALCAMTASVYVAAMGRDGLIEVATQCHAKAAYLRGELEKLGFKPLHEGAFFHEFVTGCPMNTGKLLTELEHKGILGGLELADGNILWCATELNTKEQIDALASAIREVLG